jgi:predicted Zn-dependent protease
MIKLCIFFISVIVFSSCSLKENVNIQANEKAFVDEDTYILFALRAEEVHDNKSAADLFTTLYEKSDKKEYIYRSLENDLMARENEKLIQRVDSLQKENTFDLRLLRYKVVALFELNRLDEAIQLSVLLASKTKKPNDYLLTSDIYIKRQEFDLAVKYLESAYAKENNEKILDKMSIILYVNLGRKKEAIAHLETYSRMLGYSELICLRLIAFYSNDNNIDGLLTANLRLYEFDKSPKVAKRIIQIYTYKQNYIGLTKFLEKSNSNDEVLLQLYSSLKYYDKAYVLASKLYSKTLNIDYLGQSAIYEYESALNQSSKVLLKSVITKLEKVVQANNQTIYLNYLGYILIDHEVDIKKGMKYIDRVLVLQPKSAFYLDSKAWGYYKLGECKKADKLIKEVAKMEGGDDPEVKVHIKKINKCLKNIKGKKRK